jgi:hypothetical protein
VEDWAFPLEVEDYKDHLKQKKIEEKNYIKIEWLVKNGLWTKILCNLEIQLVLIHLRVIFLVVCMIKLLASLNMCKERHLPKNDGAVCPVFLQ